MMGAPKWRQKPDANQRDIVQALEKIGCSTYDASRFGSGMTDLLVFKEDLCMLVEVKTEKGRLEQSQRDMKKLAGSCMFVVRSPLEAIEKVMAYVKAHRIR